MAEPLKNNYNRTYINHLANSLSVAYPPFPKKSFVQQVFDSEWKNRELKARMHHITHCIHTSLDLPYQQAITVLTHACEGFNGYEGMFFPDYVEQYGTSLHNFKNWRLSINALEIFTQVSSSEFAVRPFIQHSPEKMMQQMLTWSRHKHHYVRRLASEGCRPRLPWARTLPDFIEDPSLIFPVLENLKKDDSLFVRKSVANNLNDISKDHPDDVIQWGKKNLGKHPHTDWIIKKGCRTMLKQSHPGALQLFSYPNPKKTYVNIFKLNRKRLKIGQTLEIVLEAGNIPAGPLRIEYALHFPNAKGGHSIKRFHWYDKNHSANTVTLQKPHKLQQLSTRKLLAGKYYVELFINGCSKAKESFSLSV